MNTETNQQPQSKIEKLKAELIQIKESNRKREKQKRAQLQAVQARATLTDRKEEAHALCCLAGALLKYRLEIAEELLEELAKDLTAPKGNYEAASRLVTLQRFRPGKEV